MGSVSSKSSSCEDNKSQYNTIYKYPTHGIKIILNGSMRYKIIYGVDTIKFTVKPNIS